jgi:hypothetical protein
MDNNMCILALLVMMATFTLFIPGALVIGLWCALPYLELSCKFSIIHDLFFLTVFYHRDRYFVDMLYCSHKV